MSSPAEAYFTQLSARALAAAKSPPQLHEVLPVDGRGWRLHYRLGNSEVLLELSAELDASDPSRLSFSYRTPPDPDSPSGRRLKRASMLLCKALGSVRHGGPLPAVPELRDPNAEDDGDALDHLEMPERENFMVTLRGDCDRACMFCSKTLFIDPPPPLVRARLPQLKVAGTKDTSVHGIADARATTLEQLEQDLRERFGRRDEIFVGFSGRDCMSSPDFDDALRLAYHLGYRDMSVQSPGSRLLEPGFIDFLKQHSVTQVGLTAHAADEELFDRVGGKQGAYRAFWTSVEALLAEDFRVGLAVPLIAQTLDTLPRHLARLRELPCGIDCFYWYPGDGMKPLFLDIGASFEQTFDALERARPSVGPRRVSIDGIPSCVVPDSLRDHYVWSYEEHLVGYEFERMDMCGSCALNGSCPGAMPVYLAQREWPAHAAPLRELPAKPDHP